MRSSARFAAPKRLERLASRREGPAFNCKGSPKGAREVPGARAAERASFCWKRESVRRDDSRLTGCAGGRRRRRRADRPMLALVLNGSRIKPARRPRFLCHKYIDRVRAGPDRSPGPPPRTAKQAPLHSEKKRGGKDCTVQINGPDVTRASRRNFLKMMTKKKKRQEGLH